MNEELDQIQKNNTWELVPRPKDKNVIGTKWVFRNKLNDDGHVTRNKERLVCKGYAQVEGTDFNKTFAPVTKMEAIRMFLTYACSRKIKFHQMDVNSTFLNGELEEEVYIKQLEGFLLLEKKTMFADKDNLTIVEVYVDDIIFGSNDDRLSKKFVAKMQSEFEMSLLGELTYFLGLQISQQEKGIFICKAKCIKEMLKKFKMEDCKPVLTLMVTGCKLSIKNSDKAVDRRLHRFMIGSLLYVTTSRLDVMQAIGQVARFQAAPKESHIISVKRIIRYLKGTIEYGLWYPKGNNLIIQAFTDSDWAGSIDDCKSTSGATFYLGGCLISWLSKKQTSIPLSTMEEEYIAAETCCTQVLWMKQTLQDIPVQFNEPIPIFCDSTSAISISKNPVMHSKTKHIPIKYHFFKEQVTEKNIKLEYVGTKEQIADIFTKPLPCETFEYLCQKLGILPSSH
eukprot:PITA_02567